MRPIQVFIVEDEDPFRETLGAWLEPAKGIAVVGAAQDGRQLVNLLHEANPDVLLLGIGSLATNNLPAIVEQIQRRFPGLRVIVLHEDGQQDRVLEAFKAGAMGHLLKGTVQPDEVVAAVHTVNRGDVVLSSRIAGSILDEVALLQRR
jgi:DNA-binding NarL/FixJ family response regulator